MDYCRGMALCRCITRYKGQGNGHRQYHKVRQQNCQKEWGVSVACYSGIVQSRDITLDEDMDVGRTCNGASS